MKHKHGVALAVALSLLLSGFAVADEEEGALELTEQQIQAAGIQLAQAQPRSISTVLTLPGKCVSTRTALRTSSRVRPVWWRRSRSTLASR